MAFRSVHFYDSETNAPLDGLNVATLLSLYVNRAGVSLTPKPVPLALGGGAYGVQISDAHEQEGVILFFDGGAGAAPRYQAEASSVDGLRAWALLTEAGAPYAGSLVGHELGLYTNAAAVPVTPPAILQVAGAYLFAISPPLIDRQAGIAMRVDAPAGAIPTGYTDTINLEGSEDTSDPEVTVITPAAGSPITANTDLVVEAVDDFALRRLVVIARFDAENGGNGDEELVTNGERFTSRYSRSTMVEITGGLRVTVRRNGGWAQTPTLDFYAVDTSGQEA